MSKHNEMRTEAIENIIDTLENGFSGYYRNLHNEVFNTGYYVIYTVDARDALTAFDVFDALDIVTSYEKDNFGEISTDLSDPIKLANMLFYVIGDSVVSDMCHRIPAFNDNWNEEADDETNAAIVEVLKTWL